MAITGIPISEDQCIGDSLSIINSAFTTLDTRVTAAAAAAGTVTRVAGTAPISVATGTTTPLVSITAATTSAAGSMSSTDKARLNDISAITGIVKCNGSGDFSAASSGTDYVVPTGNIATATKLQTARTINGTSFDGSDNITIPSTSFSGANVAKAWVNFNGVGTIGDDSTIRNDYNVSSVTKNARGTYTINFPAGVFANSNYVVVITSSLADDSKGIPAANGVVINSSSGSGDYNRYVSKTTTSVRIGIFDSDGDNNSYQDPFDCNVAIFGN